MFQYFILKAGKIAKPNPRSNAVSSISVQGSIKSPLKNVPKIRNGFCPIKTMLNMPTTMTAAKMEAPFVSNDCHQFMDLRFVI